MCPKSPLVGMYDNFTKASKKKSAGDYDTISLTMLYLKVPLLIWFHENFELIFQKQLSCPKNMYA